jgi:hypothetical protein
MRAFERLLPVYNTMSIIATQDIRHPWSSVYAFPCVAGRLAGDESMLLVCRQDEVSRLIPDLNLLTGSLAHLARAQALLQQLEEQTAARLAGLIDTEIRPIAEDEISAFVNEVEHLLIEPNSPSGPEQRLQRLSEPDLAIKKIHGTARMLNRIRHYNHSLQQSEQTGMFVGFTAEQPRTYQRAGVEHRHLTLWQYIVARETR